MSATNSNGDGIRKNASRGGDASNSCSRRIGGVRSGVVIFVSTVLVLFFTWKSQFVDNKQGWQVGNYHLDAINKDSSDNSISIDRFDVTTKNATKVANTKTKTKNSVSEKESRTDKPKSAATREKAPIEKEQEAAKNNDVVIVSVEKQTAKTAGKEKLETVTTDVADKNRSDNNGNQKTPKTKEEKKQKPKPKPERNGDEEDARKRGESIKRKQIENYRNEKALMINVHATHHGGTTFCHEIGNNGINGGISPSFACMGDREMVMSDPPDWCDPSKDPYCYSFQDMKRMAPWAKNETGPFVEAIRPYFHMVSWEFGVALQNSVSQTDWEYPNVVSVVITRDPLTRMLASGGKTSRDYPGFNTRELSWEGWWNYAAYDGHKGTDNFFLRILLGEHKPHPSEAQKLIRNHIEEGVNRTTEEVMELYPTKIGEKEFERARSLLDRFTFVLDINCLNDGMEAVRDALSLEPPPDHRELKHKKLNKGEGKIISEKSKLKLELKKLPTRERIGYDDVYEYLVAKNEWDIALYEYSKTISLVRCE